MSLVEVVVLSRVLPDRGNGVRIANLAIGRDQGDIFDQRGGAENAIDWIVRILLGHFECL